MRTSTSGPLVQVREPSEGALDDLEKDLDQGAQSVVGVQNNRTGFSGPVSPTSDQPDPEILMPDQQLGLAEPDRIAHLPRARVVLGTEQHTDPRLPSPANDDLDEGQSETKRAYLQRKPLRADLRRLTTTLAISVEQYEQTRRAYGNAPLLGHDLDALVTLRPEVMEILSPEEKEKWWKDLMKRVRAMYAANENLPELAYVMSRESKRAGTIRKPIGIGEHAHLILAAGGHLDVLDRYFRKHLSGREVDVRPASAVTRRLNNGQIGDASTYVLKAVEPAYWREFPRTPHRASGPIYGQRVSYSLNLLDEQPIGRKPRPRRAG